VEEAQGQVQRPCFSCTLVDRLFNQLDAERLSFQVNVSINQRSNGILVEGFLCLPPLLHEVLPGTATGGSGSAADQQQEEKG
jgi:hypothetical protein